MNFKTLHEWGIPVVPKMNTTFCLGTDIRKTGIKTLKKAFIQKRNIAIVSLHKLSERNKTTSSMDEL